MEQLKAAAEHAQELMNQHGHKFVIYIRLFPEGVEIRICSSYPERLRIGGVTAWRTLRATLVSDLLIKEMDRLLDEFLYGSEEVKPVAR